MESQHFHERFHHLHNSVVVVLPNNISSLKDLITVPLTPPFNLLKELKTIEVQEFPITRKEKRKNKRKK